jgi:hypothetical protein
MYRLLKVIIAFIFLLVIIDDVVSQNESPIQFGADLMSRYIWRGVNLGGCSPVIQPWLKYKVSSKDTTHILSIGAWGSYTFSQTSNQELDLYLTYTFKNVISFALTDYFFPEHYSTKDRSSYLNYDSDSTCHVFEGSISFNGTEKIPFTFFFAMNIYGNDARRVMTDGSSGNIFMTKYVEVGYKKNIKGVDFNAFVGATIDKPENDRGELGYYGNKTAGVLNIGIKASKAIQISDKYSLPIQVSLITNPEAEKIFLVFGMSF